MVNESDKSLFLNNQICKTFVYRRRFSPVSSYRYLINYISNTNFCMKKGGPPSKL